MYCMLTAARVVACVTAVQRRVCKPICKKEEKEKNAERQRRDAKEAEAAQARAEAKRAEAEAKKAEADAQAAEAEESAKRRGHEVRPAWGFARPDVLRCARMGAAAAMGSSRNVARYA